MIVSLFTLFSFAYSASNGVGTTCNAYDPELGVNIMPWASPPVHTTNFSLTLLTNGGDGTYNPGAWHTLELRSTVYDATYRGLLLYAQDASGTKVGEWSMPTDKSRPALFWLSEKCRSEGGNVVVHMSADVKPRSTTFRWKAPTHGTGNVTFGALLKSGEANVGAFYWPNAAPLSVKERMLPATGVQWKLSAVGQSCDAVCEAAGGVCLGRQTADPEAFAPDGNLFREFNCNLPLVATCLAHAPSKDADAHGMCWHRSSACDGSTDDRPVLPTDPAEVCALTSTSEVHGRRLCACGELLYETAEEAAKDLGGVGCSGAAQAGAAAGEGSSGDTMETLIIVLALAAAIVFGILGVVVTLTCYRRKQMESAALATDMNKRLGERPSGRRMSGRARGSYGGGSSFAPHSNPPSYY